MKVKLNYEGKCVIILKPKNRKELIEIFQNKFKLKEFKKI